MSMMYYDQNMRNGDHAMAWLTNIFIQPGHVQKLALSIQGAMLSELHSAVGEGFRPFGSSSSGAISRTRDP